MSNTLKQDLIGYLEDIGNSRSAIVPDKGNTNRFLFDVFIAQETKAWAEANLKKAWAAVQDPEDVALVPTDDELRDKDPGDYIVADTKQFSCTVQVAKPGTAFQRDEFVELIIKRFKLDRNKVKKAVQECMKENNPALTKRVLEVT